MNKRVRSLDLCESSWNCASVTVPMTVSTQHMPYSGVYTSAWSARADTVSLMESSTLVEVAISSPLYIKLMSSK